MSDDKTVDRAEKEKKRDRGDRVEVVKVLVLALVSFLLGFGLVVVFLGPSGSGSPAEMDFVGEATPPEEPVRNSESVDARQPDQPAGAGYAPGDKGNPLIEDGQESGGDPEAPEEAGQVASEGDAPPEVPPGKTPEGVALNGDAFYLKCWDADGKEVPGGDCDKLEVLEKRMSTRLYVVDRCRQKHSGEKSEGKLSLGLEVDFAQNTLSFWNGASSDIANAAQVATCLRDELSGLPIHSVDHKYPRYRVFFTVLFGKAGALDGTPLKKTSPRSDANGKMVDVTMDHVRVRATPENGDVIGKISSGNQVTLVGKKKGWCEVITPNGNRGWMTCEALSQ